MAPCCEYAPHLPRGSLNSSSTYKHMTKILMGGSFAFCSEPPLEASSTEGIDEHRAVSLGGNSRSSHVVWGLRQELLCWSCWLQGRWWPAQEAAKGFCLRMERVSGSPSLLCHLKFINCIRHCLQWPEEGLLGTGAKRRSWFLSIQNMTSATGNQL